MKQRKATAILALLLAIVLVGCREAEPAETTNPETESAAVTTTAETVAVEPPLVQNWISQEQAMLAGFVVIQDGDVRHNLENWQHYMEAVERKEVSSVTVIHYFRTDAGFEQIRYDLKFDGTLHQLSYIENGNKVEKTYTRLLKQQVELDESWEPYDCAIRYVLVSDDSDYVLFEDLIAETDLDGVTEIGLYLKEGDPALKVYRDPAQVKAVLSLLSHAEYLSGDPENYYYGAKLIMVNGKGEQLVLELDLNQGNYRFGMQTYCYGDVSDLLNVLSLDKWPDEVYAEHGNYIE